MENVFEKFMNTQLQKKKSQKFLESWSCLSSGLKQLTEFPSVQRDCRF